MTETEYTKTQHARVLSPVDRCHDYELATANGIHENILSEVEFLCGTDELIHFRFYRVCARARVYIYICMCVCVCGC